MTQQNNRQRRHAAHRWAAAARQRMVGLGNGAANEAVEGGANTRGTARMNENDSTSPRSAMDIRVSRMKMCSRCCRAKYCSKLCQVYDWRSGRHKMECQFL